MIQSHYACGTKYLAWRDWQAFLSKIIYWNFSPAKTTILWFRKKGRWGFHNLPITLFTSILLINVDWTMDLLFGFHLGWISFLSYLSHTQHIIKTECPPIQTYLDNWHLLSESWLTYYLTHIHNPHTGKIGLQMHYLWLLTKPSWSNSKWNCVLYFAHSVLL